MASLNKTNRQKKVSLLIQESLIEILAKGKKLDQKLLDNKITITNVTITPDLKLADCFFIPFGNSNITKDEILYSLETSKHALRQQVTEKINLKYSPALRFFYDYGYENMNKVSEALSKLNISEKNS